MRAAVYFTPPEEAELTRLAAEWLGRDAFTGMGTRAPDPLLDPLVAEPARYGFHATLRAPFRLRDGSDLSDVRATLTAVAERSVPARIDRLKLARLGSFFALVPSAPESSISKIERAVVETFEPFRAPLNEAEIARRRPERLTDRQRENLERWGYPFVREDFRFHMTLTGPVDVEQADRIEGILAERFAPVLGQPLAIDGLALFTEDRAGTPFRVDTYRALAPSL